ncbi:S-layer homology domain-containing protein [Desulfoscipio gibsoniae]
MRTKSWKCFIGGLLTVAVLTFAVTAAPADVLARSNGKGNNNKPPGQVKKIEYTQTKKMPFRMMGDVVNHWAAEPVSAMQKQGIIAGFPDGKFYPQKEVSKNEALVMLMRALGCEDQAPSQSSLKLVTKSWAGDMVALALDKGIITREELKDFDGTEAAQRYEVAMWLARALLNNDRLENVLSGEVQFSDAGQIPGYAEKYVAQMSQAGIMKGYPGNVFKPRNKVQRAEIAAMLFRCQYMFSLNPKFNYIKGIVDEVMPSDPAYISLKVGDDDNSPLVLVQVADDAAIFIDGKAADLEDIEKDYAVSMVLNPARNAIVVSAGSDGAAGNDDADEEEDEDAPEVDELNPENDAENVPAGLDTLVVTFDEKIYPVKSLNDIKEGIEVENITDDRSIDIWDIDIDGRKLIIELKKELDEDCRFAVDVAANIIKDGQGNKFAGIDSEDWEFATFEDEDEDAPEIDELNPEDGEEFEGDLEEITVQFDEKVRWVGKKPNENAVIVFNRARYFVIIPDDIDIDEDELIIQFDRELPVGEYNISIPSGIIEDLSGNEFSGIGVTDWTFEVVAEEDD